MQRRKPNSSQSSTTIFILILPSLVFLSALRQAMAFLLGKKYEVIHDVNFTTYRIDLEPKHNVSYDNLVVGIDQSFLTEPCSSSLNSFLNCDSRYARSALYWIQLLAPVTGNLTFRMYNEEQGHQWSMDLEHGQIDIADKPVVVAPNLYGGRQPRYHVTTPARMVQYYMYMGMKDDTEGQYDETSLKFLAAPFSKDAWTLVLVSIILAFVLDKVMWFRVSSISRSPGSRSAPLSYRCFAIVLFGCAFLAAAYKSSLNALLTVRSSTKGPFRDLYELARQVENKSRILLVDDMLSLRWALLAKSDIASFYDQFQTLHTTIMRTGINQTLKFEPNITEICRKLYSSDRYVFFGHEEAIRANLYCSGHCYWWYTITELPNVPMTWAVSKNNSVLARTANIVVHALEGYREAQSRRLLPPGGCSYTKKMTRQTLSERHLRIAFLWLCSGEMGAVIILAVEWFSEFIRKRRRTLWSPQTI